MGAHSRIMTDTWGFVLEERRGSLRKRDYAGLKVGCRVFTVLVGMLNTSCAWVFTIFWTVQERGRFGSIYYMESNVIP